MNSRNAIYLVCLCFISMITGAGCSSKIKKDRPVDWKVTLSKRDKKPYGAYLAYQSLKYYFPQARIASLSKDAKFNKLEEGGLAQHGPDSVSLLLFEGIGMRMSQKEVDGLLAFAETGNEVMLFVSRPDPRLEQRLGFSKNDDGEEMVPLQETTPGDSNEHALWLRNPAAPFGMHGRYILGYFSIADSASGNSYYTDTLSDFIEAGQISEEDTRDAAQPPPPEILGYAKGRPNLIRYSIGRGHITLHAAPLVLSNYFLLQHNNRQYLDSIWQTLPPNISRVYWNDFLVRNVQRQGSGGLLRFPALMNAFLVMLFTLLIYVLFESKRRQRIVPIIKKPVNSSVSFVETVGSLYYNKGNHSNLAEKMVQHFLEWVRTKFNLNTKEMGEGFTYQLTIKSGLPATVVQEMVQMVEEVRNRQVKVDEPYLFHLYHTIQQFYKNHKN